MAAWNKQVSEAGYICEHWVQLRDLPQIIMLKSGQERFLPSVLGLRTHACTLIHTHVCEHAHKPHKHIL